MFFKRIQYNSPVILTFALLSLFALLLGRITNELSTVLLFSVYRSPLSDPLFYLRLFGHVLGHVDFPHYFNNFILILLVGPMLEEKYGSKNILIMILVTSLATGVVNVVFTSNQLLGASGIVFMLILLSSFVNLQKGMVPFTLILVIIIFIGQEVLNGLTKSDNISNYTHIVGGICGAISGFVINNKIIKGESNER